LGEASRGNQREAPSPPVPSSPGPSAIESPAVPPPAPPAAPPPAHHAPVAGLNQIETDHAVTIVNVGKRKGLPVRARVVAIATVLQESFLRNLANPNVPASLGLSKEGVERDSDSVGLFQQRPSQGWGTVAELMDPETSAALFYARLTKVPGWETLSVGAAAQAVQRSAFPTAYDKHQALAQRIVDAIGG
jgi:hypothetical protein